MKKSAFCLCLLALAALPAMAADLYNNGAVNGTMNAWPISFGSAVEDSFTLSSDSSLSSATFYVWAPTQGDVVTSVDWGIESTPGGYNTPHFATTTQTYLFTNDLNVDGNQYQFDIDEETISISGTYAPGTYYFVLANANVANEDTIYWDVNNGPSSAYVSSQAGNVANVLFPGTNSDPFEIDGTVLPPGSVVPEPCSLLLLGSGLAGLVARKMRRKTNAELRA